MIAILVPVLGRPHRAAPLAENIALATSVPYRLVFLVSPSDDAQWGAIRELEEEGDDAVVCGWEPGPGDYARKINLGFRVTDEPFVVTGADDLDFQPGWAEAALKVAEQTGAGVVGTNDNANPMVKRGQHSTHSLVRRTYIEERGGSFDETPGVLYPECYDHQCVDNELVEVAGYRGEWAFASDSMVIHRHPFFDRTVVKDATYEKALRHGREDIRLLNARRRDWHSRRGAASVEARVGGPEAARPVSQASTAVTEPAPPAETADQQLGRE